MVYLRQTIEADPADALGLAGLALGTSIAAHGLGLGVVPPREAYPPAKSAAIRALKLDDTLAEAHAALALVNLYYDWDWAGAEESFRRALSLNANIPEAHRHFAWYHALFEFPHLEEAVGSMKRAQEVAPLTPIYTAELG